MTVTTNRPSTTYYATTELRLLVAAGVLSRSVRDDDTGWRAGDIVLAALRSQGEELRAQDPRVRQEVPGSVTLMRVAARRLRSTLRGFGRILNSEHTLVVADELKWLGAQLAEGHDTEVMIERFTHVVRDLPQHMIVGPLATDLERSLGQLAQQGEQTITAALNSHRYLALQDMLAQLLHQPPMTRRAQRPALTELPKSVAKAFRKLDRLLDAAIALPPGAERDGALHEARKADKQVRYMTDVVAPVIGGPAGRLRRQTTKLQDLLGDYQDAVVARPVLRQLATAANEQGHNAFTYSVLYASEHARMERVMRELPHRLEHLRDDRTLSWLRPQPGAFENDAERSPCPSWRPAQAGPAP
jgi:CHAD domain-containing protein